jgi:hypothetical protein
MLPFKKGLLPQALGKGLLPFMCFLKDCCLLPAVASSIIAVTCAVAFAFPIRLVT